ncbi:hypothetical protein FRC12_002971 [Ceratobasidium sp. 428]|nr:hypothetical protein FRC12_002971 [Ceratobasidium sp. 428]
MDAGDCDQGPPALNEAYNVVPSHTSIHQRIYRRNPWNSSDAQGNAAAESELPVHNNCELAYISTSASLPGHTRAPLLDGLLRLTGCPVSPIPIRLLPTQLSTRNYLPNSLVYDNSCPPLFAVLSTSTRCINKLEPPCRNKTKQSSQRMTDPRLDTSGYLILS